MEAAQLRSLTPASDKDNGNATRSVYIASSALCALRFTLYAWRIMECNIMMIIYIVLNTDIHTIRLCKYIPTHMHCGQTPVGIHPTDQFQDSTSILYTHGLTFSRLLG